MSTTTKQHSNRALDVLARHIELAESGIGQAREECERHRAVAHDRDVSPEAGGRAQALADLAAGR